MATLTQEEIEQKKRLLKEKMDEIHAIHVELVEAGAYPLDDDELDGIAGGKRSNETIDKLKTIIVEGTLKDFTDGSHLY